MKAEADKIHSKPPMRSLGQALKQGTTFTRLVCVSSVMSAVLAGCGGDPGPVMPGFSSSSAASKASSSKPVVSSSKAVSSSSKAGSSSAGSVSSTGSGGNIAKGKAKLEGLDCVDCHAASATPGVFTKLNPNDLKFAASARYPGYGPLTESNLAKFITATMPANSVGLCDVECGKDVAAYIWSLRAGGSSASSSSSVPPAACAGDNPVLYGKRGAKVLTSYEYQNSLQALFAKPLAKDYTPGLADDNIDRIPSQIRTTIRTATLKGYDAIAAEVAEWAMNTPGALPFSCDKFNSADCATAFIDKFATLAYRRPLTATEKADYTNMIVSGFTPTSGVQWAIRTVLSSAAFLYRTESGILVSDYRAKGWGIAPANFGGPVDVSAGVKIQAENYSQMSGIQLEDTMDTGGGKM